LVVVAGITFTSVAEIAQVATVVFLQVLESFALGYVLEHD
jgi:hypothetical protein